VAYSNHARLPHLGSCLSCLDILTCLYFNVLRVDPRAPTHPLRDRFVLSKGHGAPALFQVLARRGFYPPTDLYRPDHGGGLFGEHPPTPDHLAGGEAATGSLGHGLPMAVGMALAGRINRLDYRVFALLSDGECDEGSIWEAALFAAAQKLERLMVVIDYNKWQATGRSEEVLAARAARREMACLRLERRGSGRSRHDGPAGTARPPAERVRQARRHCRPHGEGPRRLLHGGRQQLALPHPDSRRSRGRPARARGRIMRNAFADEITSLGQRDPRIVLLSGDIGNRLFDRFKAAAPDRFFNCGWPRRT
jgi:transketolase N-terminal domain/subunit